MPILGLVTVLYKSDEVLAGFFDSLARQDHPSFHLYIIDNSPSSTTEQLLARLTAAYRMSFTHIRNEANAGVAAANNQGIKLALADKCDYVVLLNNDIEFYQPSLLSELVLISRERAEKMIIPKIFYYGSRTIWMAGGKWLKFKGYTTHIGEDKEDSPAYNTPQHFNYAPTCFMLIHSSVFDKIGLMDERYFVYYDDTDFVYRAVERGYSVYYVPHLEVFHKVSSSTGGYQTPFSMYYANRNRIYFISKNLKGADKLITFAYTLLTRAVIWLRSDHPQRKNLLTALLDGFKLSKSL